MTGNLRDLEPSILFQDEFQIRHIIQILCQIIIYYPLIHRIVELKIHLIFVIKIHIILKIIRVYWPYQKIEIYSAANVALSQCKR